MQSISKAPHENFVRTFQCKSGQRRYLKQTTRMRVYMKLVMIMSFE
jgi:hypothetical protein